MNLIKEAPLQNLDLTINRKAMGTTEPVNTKDYIKILNLTDSLDGMAEGTKNSLFFEKLWTNPTLHLQFIMRE